MGPEASTQFPRASVAMKPHITPTLHPDGLLQLLSDEDIKEEAIDKDKLAETHYALPSTQPNPFTTHPKDIVFVERRGRSLNMGVVLK